MARHEAMNAKAKAGGIDLIYIGDSIVEFFETQGLDIFQRWEKPTPERDVLAKANEIISRLDDGKTIHFTDINDLFVQAEGSIPADLMPDFEHTSATRRATLKRIPFKQSTDSRPSSSEAIWQHWFKKLVENEGHWHGRVPPSDSWPQGCLSNQGAA